MHVRHSLSAAAVLLAGTLLTQSARAAESNDTCTGFIDTVPTTITTQGVWCLDSNLSTGIAAGSAITVGTNNVTIDCNDFKLGGLAAGSTSQAVGIHAVGRHNVTIRNCSIRGFHRGLSLEGGGSGHRIEDNRLDNNLMVGVYVEGEHNLVRNNQVFDTGGYTGGGDSVIGIYAAADVIDNTVAGAFNASEAHSSSGITIPASGAEVRHNRVRGINGVLVYGIFATGGGVTIDSNRVSALSTTSGTGVYGVGVLTFCTNNTVVNYTSAYAACEASADNLELPVP